MLEFETKRRARLGDWLKAEEAKLRTTPRLLVEAHPSITGARLDQIHGLTLEPGKLTLTFQRPQECRVKLLALAHAMALELEEFDRRVVLEDPVQSPTPPRTSSHPAA